MGHAILAYARSFSVIARLGLQRAPFMARVPAESAAMGASGWVGHVGTGKVVVKGAITSLTLEPLAHAAITVLTRELFRFGSEASTVFLRSQLAAMVHAGVDTSFCNPSQAAVVGLSPAAITNGAPHYVSNGATAEAAEADIQSLVSLFVANGGQMERAVFLLSSTNAVWLALSGHTAFERLRRDGGELGGCPAVCSDSVGERVILVDTSKVLLADDDQVDITLAEQASVEMSNTPTGHAGTPTAATGMVSLFQANAVAFRVSRIVNWKALTGACAYIENAAYVSPGSPA
jgi:hypothetical protein